MRGTNKAERFLAGSAIALTVGLAWADAHAQAPTPAASPESSEIVVTGSRIRGVAPVGSALIAVNREDIQASNAVTVTQLLQELPQVLNLGVSDSSRGQPGGSSNITYGNSVNIRGIGPFATLVIVDGHRVPPQGTSGFAVDPAILPTLGLQRVDIVADGASAIYGSDAVAGVVNLILRRNLQGGEISARYGTGDSYDEHQYGIAYGHKWDRGQITVAFENGFNGAINGADRDFFRADLRADGGGDFRSSNCAPGNIVIGGVSYAIPAGGVTAANRSALVAGTANKCDLFKNADLRPEQDHNNLVYTADFQATNRIKVYTEGFAARREFTLKMGEGRAAAFAVPATNAFFVSPIGAVLTPCAASPNYPAGTLCETVQYSPAGDYPQAYSDGYSEVFNLLVGTEVDLGHDWKFGGSYSWGKNQDEQNSWNNPPSTTPTSPLTIALASSNPATAFNPFGPGGANARFEPTFLVNRSNAKGHTVFQTFEATVDGPVLALPGGELRAAMGYEGQKSHIASVQYLGTYTAPTGAVREFARDVDSFYGELQVPIAGGDFTGPGMRGLDVNLAVRYDKYTDVGDTTNPKVGVNWMPVEGLKIHGSWGTSFRAPGIAQIYGNSNNLFRADLSDPTCGCLTTTISRSGGNLSLTPETAETYSAGFDLTPTMIPGLRLGASYFNVTYENQVVAFLGDTTVLQKEAQFAGTNVILRNPSAAFLAQQVAETGATTSLAGVTVFVDGRTQNVGVSESEGVDLQASYALETNSLGNFNFSVNGTKFLSYHASVTPAAPSLDKLNKIFNPLELRARYGVRWSAGPWQANLFANYTNSYTNDVATPVQEVKASTTVDGQINVTLGKDMTGVRDIVLGLGVQNLFDQDPPFVNIAQSPNGGGGFDPTLVNPAGRVVSVSLSAKF